jgi:RNA recognition motif-containing protein
MVRFHMNEQGKPKGFCHVEFSKPEDCSKAVEQ